MASSFTYNDKGWQTLKSRLDGIKGSYVKVGVMASKGGEVAASDAGSGADRTFTARDPITMLELAAIHEFGSPAANIPERSFIRRTFAVRGEELQKMITRLVRSLSQGKVGAATALDLLGQWGVNAVKNTITRTRIPPPLAKRTEAAKRAKGRDQPSRPLVDTGRLLGAIQYEVLGPEE